MFPKQNSLNTNKIRKRNACLLIQYKYKKSKLDINDFDLRHWKNEGEN